MKEQGIHKAFAQYVSLSMLSMLGLSCYILADTYFISGGVGAIGVAALNIVLPVYTLVNGLGLMLGMGAATRYAVFRAENREREASACFTHAFWMGCLLGGLFTLAGAFFARPLARLLGAEGAVVPLAGEYLRTILLFGWAFIPNQIMVCFVRNDKRPRLAMLAMLCGSFGNVALDYLFIFPLEMGMFGAALATGLAPVLSMLILLIHRLKRENRFHLIQCTPSVMLVGQITSLGLSSLLTELSAGILMLVFNFIILGLEGSTGVAAYGIIANIALVAAAIFTGIAQGIQPIVSAGLGSGDIEGVKKVLRSALILATGLGLLFWLAGALFAAQITAIFNSQGNAVLAELTVRGIRIYFVAFLLMGANIVTAAFFAAFSRPISSFVICAVRGFAAAIPCGLLLSWIFGMDGVWFAVLCAEVAAALCSGVFLIRFLAKKQTAF